MISNITLKESINQYMACVACDGELTDTNSVAYHLPKVYDHSMGSKRVQ